MSVFVWVLRACPDVCVYQGYLCILYVCDSMFLLSEAVGEFDAGSQGFLRPRQTPESLNILLNNTRDYHCLLMPGDVLIKSSK